MNLLFCITIVVAFLFSFIVWIIVNKIHNGLKNENENSKSNAVYEEKKLGEKKKITNKLFDKNYKERWESVKLKYDSLLKDKPQDFYDCTDGNGDKLCSWYEEILKIITDKDNILLKKSLDNTMLINDWRKILIQDNFYTRSDFERIKLNIQILETFGIKILT